MNKILTSAKITTNIMSIGTKACPRWFMGLATLGVAPLITLINKSFKIPIIGKINPYILWDKQVDKTYNGIYWIFENSVKNSTVEKCKALIKKNKQDEAIKLLITSGLTEQSITNALTSITK